VQGASFGFQEVNQFSAADNIFKCPFLIYPEGNMVQQTLEHSRTFI